eukprot:gnl/MRDRNA2_/MRDRNA2_186602_c0_seq1.p1 gnl/MRDRNA2_/MRDRNA2_186602_c0~~gnl/MRDRNA2_/MRDRNA2_186602_c0_seq1.p1  ORF type:complete len:269 (+),score=38.56 gnl/MRDRNA2_/MRDRNA2_186602_c0_seq1:113-919(+)
MRPNSADRSASSSGGYGPVGSGRFGPVGSEPPLGPQANTFVTTDDVFGNLLLPVRIHNTFVELEEEDEFKQVRRTRCHSHSGSSRRSAGDSSNRGSSRSSPRESRDLPSPGDLQLGDPQSQSVEQTNGSGPTDQDPVSQQFQESVGDAPLAVDELPSIGSVNHHEGTCQPCYFSTRSTDCFAGKDCPYCHMPHDKKPRAGKKSRERARRRQKAHLDSIQIDKGHGQQQLVTNQEAFHIQWDSSESGASASQKSGEPIILYPEGTKISL